MLVTERANKMRVMNVTSLIGHTSCHMVCRHYCSSNRRRNLISGCSGIADYAVYYSVSISDSTILKGYDYNFISIARRPEMLATHPRVNQRVRNIARLTSKATSVHCNVAIAVTLSLLIIFGGIAASYCLISIRTSFTQNDSPIISLHQPIDKPKSDFMLDLKNGNILPPIPTHAVEYVTGPALKCIHMEATTGAVMSLRIESDTLDAKYENISGGNLIDRSDYGISEAIAEIYGHSMIDQLPAVKYEQIEFVSAGKREPRIGNSAYERVTNKASPHNPSFPQDIHPFRRGSWGKAFPHHKLKHDTPYNFTSKPRIPLKERVMRLFAHKAERAIWLRQQAPTNRAIAHQNWQRCVGEFHQTPDRERKACKAAYASKRNSMTTEAFGNSHNGHLFTAPFSYVVIGATDSRVVFNMRHRNLNHSTPKPPAAFSGYPAMPRYSSTTVSRRNIKPIHIAYLSLYKQSRVVSNARNGHQKLNILVFAYHALKLKAQTLDLFQKFVKLEKERSKWGRTAF